MCMLHLSAAHEQIVETIQVLSVEETDLDFATTICRLKYLHLCTQCAPQLGLGGLDVWIDGARGRGSPGRFLLNYLVDQMLGRAYRQSAVDDLPGDAPLNIWLT